MKFLILAFLLATCVGANSVAVAQKVTSWSWPQRFDKVWVSDNGARVVTEYSPFADEDAPPIQIYDASSGRKLGHISRARRLLSPHVEGEETRYVTQNVSVQAISSDGRHLIVQRWPAQEDDIKDFSVEAWNISQSPHIEWRKRGLECSDARWTRGHIIVLLANELQRWSVRGKLLSRLPIAGSSDANILSPDGTRTIVNAAVSAFIDTRTGHVLQTLKLPYPDQPVSWIIGPKNLFIWGHSLTPDEGFAPWDNYALWRLRDGKRYNFSLQNIVFSPDGSAFWDIRARRFRSIATGIIAPIRVPKAFAQNEAFLQAISGDGRVWAGQNRQGQIFWTVEKAAPAS